VGNQEIFKTVGEKKLLFPVKDQRDVSPALKLDKAGRTQVVAYERPRTQTKESVQQRITSGMSSFLLRH
jgi:hypothetical protein